MTYKEYLESKRDLWPAKDYLYEALKWSLEAHKAEDFLTEALDLLEKAEWIDVGSLHGCQWCKMLQTMPKYGGFHADDCPWLLLMQKAGRR